jgi:hypothetical protein
MFSATRYYGWPFPYLSVHKEVDSYEEASLVTTEPVSTLVSSGWKANFSGHTEKSLLGSPSLSFLADLIFSFAIALSVLLVLIIIKRRFRSKA